MDDPPETSGSIPPEQSQQIRRLAHDLSNALEIIVQTSFLLNTLDLDANGKQWLGLLETGIQQAININRELREYIRLHS